MSSLTTFYIVLALLALALVGALIAFPLEEGPHSGPEAAAATALKSGILPAEVQFQAGDYVDPAHTGATTVLTYPPNGPGEFGFTTELSGLVTTPGGITLDLLAPTYQSPNPLISGYHVIIYLPNGLHAALCDPYPLKGRGDPAASALRKQHWIAYTWPDRPTDGRMMFAIDQTGNIHAHPYPGTPPAWNALYTRDATPIGPPPPPGTWLSPVSPDWRDYRR